MQLAFDSRGAGPPLILLDALGADRRVWDPVMDRLSAGSSDLTGSACYPSPTGISAQCSESNGTDAARKLA